MGQELICDIERALVVKGEWLERIFDNGKVWEMRSTSTSIRGRIGLIESGSGLVVGEVSIIDVLGPMPNDHLLYHTDKHQIQINDVGTWRYAWVLKNPIRYGKPIRYKHPRGAVVWVKLGQNRIGE
jgi:hypothetical protein